MFCSGIVGCRGPASAPPDILLRFRTAYVGNAANNVIVYITVPGTLFLSRDMFVSFPQMLPQKMTCPCVIYMWCASFLSSDTCRLMLLPYLLSELTSILSTKHSNFYSVNRPCNQKLTRTATANRTTYRDDCEELPPGVDGVRHRKHRSGLPFRSIRQAFQVSTAPFNTNSRGYHPLTQELGRLMMLSYYPSLRSPSRPMRSNRKQAIPKSGCSLGYSRSACE